MKDKYSKEERAAFCRAYLRTMDPERAAAESGCADGFSMLGRKQVRRQMEKMRTDAAGQLRREDVVRRLAQLAFGRANDAARLALWREGTDPEGLDLSAVAELKVTDKGGMEIKLVDRVRALEALCGLLEETDGGAEALLRALGEEVSGEEGEENG